MPDFFSPINDLGIFLASWIPRIPHVNVLGERHFALDNLAPHHERIISSTFPDHHRHHAEQVHGRQIQIIAPDIPPSTHPSVDGLVTNLPGRLLAIYVADCAAIYLADPVSKAIGLLHSGKKGTELNILAEAVAIMNRNYGTRPENLTVVISPCIRPPDYETDFATTIATQASQLGIQNFHDRKLNTASDLTQNYSYRLEKGQTGRMLALLSIPHPPLP